MGFVRPDPGTATGSLGRVGARGAVQEGAVCVSPKETPWSIQALKTAISCGVRRGPRAGMTSSGICPVTILIR